MARIAAICVSEKRGTSKSPAVEVEAVAGKGLRGDGHAGPGPRQLSILSTLSLDRMRDRGIEVCSGCCGENIDIEGSEMASLIPGALLSLGDGVLVRITGIGKDNTDGHADRVIKGNIFPDEGAFAEVLEGGALRTGDPVGFPRESGFNAGVLTVSDSCCRGEREDQSGPEALFRLESAGISNIRYAISADDRSLLEEKLTLWCDDRSLDLLVTTGGTGLSPSDHTPEATLAVSTRLVPGIPEMLRYRSSKVVSTAWLSRGACGIRGRTLIVNLPGSRKAVSECLGFLLEILDHALEVVRGEVSRCGG